MTIYNIENCESPDFTIEDIHKIREQNYERTKDSRLYLAKISLKTRKPLDFSLKTPYNESHKKE